MKLSLLKNNSNIEYDILIPPFEKSPENMTSTMAKKYFEWYISKVPERTDYLLQKCGYLNNNTNSKLAYTPESLVLVWKWFLSLAKIEETPKAVIDEYKKTMTGMPESFIEHMTIYEKRRFSLITSYIIRDIGMYLGHVFITNHPSISWGYYTSPKSDVFINQPVLLGFEDREYVPVYKPKFEPIHMVSVQAANIFDKTASKNDLYNLYIMWKQNTK